MRKLLDTSLGNTKVSKTESLAPGVRLASLSLMPDKIICPQSGAADCFNLCIKKSGRGRFENVAQGRQLKTDYWHHDRDGFLTQLKRELANFEKLCYRTNKRPVVRLNVLSDIQWEKHGIPQAFPGILAYDYTKQAHRIGKTPENYKLMFSYSGAAKYQHQVQRAMKTNAPISVVFTELPTDPNYRFLGRPVIDGDRSDLINVNAGPVIIGLRYKNTGASADTIAESTFVVDPNQPFLNLIARVA